MAANLYDDFEKHPSEQYTKVIDYAGRLPTGATIVSVSVFEAIDLLDGSDASALVGTPGAVGSYGAGIPVTAGTDGHDYLISVNLTLSNANVLNAQVKMRLRRRMLM